MDSLTAKNYRNIIDFYNYVNKDFSNYENIVLLSLATIFDIRFSAFVTYRTTPEGELTVERTVSTSIQKGILSKYKNSYYRDDVFVKRFPQIYHNDSGKFYYTDSELDCDDFANSEYGRVLRKNSIAHEAVIGINGSNSSIIQMVKIFRTEDAGDFSDTDRELFQYIGEAFNDSKALCSRFLLEQRRLEAVSAYCDEQDFGFAILDGKARLIHKNECFTKYNSELSPGLTKREIARDIIRAVTGGDRLPDQNYYSEEAVVDGLKVTLQKKKAALSLRTEDLYFITIREDKEKKTSAGVRTKLPPDLGLTHREAEVAELVVNGYGNQEIADELFIGLSTVKSHISNIYSKLGVNSRHDLLNSLNKT